MSTVKAIVLNPGCGVHRPEAERMSEKRIVQYRAVSRNGRSYSFGVIGAYKIPRFTQIHRAGVLTFRANRLRRFEFTTIHSGHLSKKAAFAMANALNALNALPLHETREASQNR